MMRIRKVVYAEKVSYVKLIMKRILIEYDFSN